MLAWEREKLLDQTKKADYGAGANGGRDRRGVSARHRQVWTARRDLDGVRLGRWTVPR